MKHRRMISLLLALCLTVGILGNGAYCLALDEDNAYQEHREEPSFRRSAPVEEQVTCRSGTDTLSGTLTRPEEITEHVPLVILLHGLSSDSRWCVDVAWYLAAAGIASVRFDFAGSGLSTGRQEDMTISSEVQNTVDILRYVKSLDFVDTDNIFLLGKSMGGVNAVLANQRFSGEVKALCLWYPGFAIKETVRHGFLLGTFFDPFDLPETVNAVFYNYGRGFLEEAAQLDYASACRATDIPVLIVHGDRDFIAPIVFSFQMEDVFPDCRLKLIPGGYHGFWGVQEMEALGETLRFLQEQISERH